MILYLVATILTQTSFRLPAILDNMPEQNPNSPAAMANTYVRTFQDGGVFDGLSPLLLVKNEPDASALEVFERHLREDDGHVRENIVELLVNMGIQCGDAQGRGIACIDHPAILRVLCGAALERVDVAREKAMLQLRRLVSGKDLAPWTFNFVKAIEAGATDEALLLAAKSKAIEGQEVVARLAREERWGSRTSVRITQAALGDRAMESSFVSDLELANTEGDPDKFATAIAALSLIGTGASLKLVAENMRTPLLIDVPMAGGKSMRLEVLEGLMYNFPAESVLYPGGIISEADYSAAERFCSIRLGAVYSSPVPPFMTYKGYPSPALDEK